MIEVEFKNQNQNQNHWQTWDFRVIGEFSTLELAIEAINLADYELNQIDDYTYQGFYKKEFYKSEVFYYFRFVDVETKELISIESPWKVGLNK